MIRWWLLGACVASLALVEGDARACGGCFHAPNPPPEEVTVVTGHRMAFSISTRQTVLWDQVVYDGNPTEFAWVLPVLPGAVIQESRDEWFAALDSATQPVINASTTVNYYPAQSGGCFALGCGSSSAGDNAGAGSSSGSGPVQVLSQGVVGPYETVTLQSTNPTALTDWLQAHSFDIPDSMTGTIQYYVQGGFDFIALRLRPQCNVRAMKPVRIVSPGADPTLPLRMVAAGVGANVDVLLWVIGEGRWKAQNFPEVTISDSQLSWDTKNSTSNYVPLATSLMAQQGGTSWLTEFANPVSSSVYYPSSYGSSGTTANPSLAQAYYAFCGGATPTNGSTVVQPTPCAQGDGADAGDAGTGDDAGDAADAGEDAVADAGTGPSGSSSGSSGSSSGPPAGALGCDAFDDLSVALDGISPDSVWLTRMRASLPVAALGQDLILTAAEQAPVSNVHTAVQDAPQTAAPSSSACESSAKRKDTFGSITLLALTAAALAAMLRRRRTR